MEEKTATRPPTALAIGRKIFFAMQETDDEAEGSNSLEVTPSRLKTDHQHLTDSINYSLNSWWDTKVRLFSAERASLHALDRTTRGSQLWDSKGDLDFPQARSKCYYYYYHHQHHRQGSNSIPGIHTRQISQQRVLNPILCVSVYLMTALCTKPAEMDSIHSSGAASPWHCFYYYKRL